jgi:hypothetical protein
MEFLLSCGISSKNSPIFSYEYIPIYLKDPSCNLRVVSGQATLKDSRYSTDGRRYKAHLTPSLLGKRHSEYEMVTSWNKRSKKQAQRIPKWFKKDFLDPENNIVFWTHRLPIYQKLAITPRPGHEPKICRRRFLVPRIHRPSKNENSKSSGLLRPSTYKSAAKIKNSLRSSLDENLTSSKTYENLNPACILRNHKIENEDSIIQVSAESEEWSRKRDAANKARRPKRPIFTFTGAPSSQIDVALSPEPRLLAPGIPLDTNAVDENHTHSDVLSTNEECSDNDTSRSSPTSHSSVTLIASEEASRDAIKSPSEETDTKQSPKLPEALAKIEGDNMSADANTDEGETPGVSNHTAIAQLEEFLTSSQKELEDLTHKDNEARQKHNESQREKVRKTDKRYRAFKSELADRIGHLARLIKRLDHTIIVLKENEGQQKIRNDTLLKEVADAKALQEQERQALELKKQKIEQIRNDLAIIWRKLSKKLDGNNSEVNMKEEPNAIFETRLRELQERESKLEQRELALDKECKEFIRARSEAERQEVGERKRFFRAEGEYKPQAKEQQNKIDNLEREKGCMGVDMKDLRRDLLQSEARLDSLLIQNDNTSEQMLSLQLELEETRKGHESELGDVRNQNTSALEREKRTAAEALKEQNDASQAKAEETKAAADRVRQEALEEQQKNHRLELEEAAKAAAISQQEALEKQDKIHRAALAEEKAKATALRRALKEQQTRVKLGGAKAVPKRRRWQFTITALVGAIILSTIAFFSLKGQNGIITNTGVQAQDVYAPAIAQETSFPLGIDTSDATHTLPVMAVTTGHSDDMPSPPPHPGPNITWLSLPAANTGLASESVPNRLVQVHFIINGLRGHAGHLLLAIDNFIYSEPSHAERLPPRLQWINQLLFNPSFNELGGGLVAAYM